MRGHDVNDASGVDDDGEAPAPPARKGLLGRNLTKLQPSEQYAAFAIGGLVALHGILGLAGVDDTQPQHSTTVWFFASVIAGGLLIASARARRRYPTGLLAVATTFVLPGTGVSLVLEFACLVLGSVVFLRTSSDRARQAGERRRRERDEMRAARADGRPPPRGRAARAAAATGPKANKRYTPPKPKPKKVAPPPEPASKRGRRRGGASDDTDADLDDEL